MQALLLPVGADLYALPVDWVREVVAAPTVARLVTAPPVVIGLFNLRGQVVPLLDTAALMGLGRIEAPAFAVVVDCAHGLVGLATTGFPERHVLGEPSGPSELPGTAGLYQVDQRVAAVLDPVALLAPDRLRGPEARVDQVGIGAG